MKIVRQVSPDMRGAMRAIRAQLGEDAVILSSRKIPEGVEVTAAIDFDTEELRGAMNSPHSLLPAPESAPAVATPAPQAVAAPAARAQQRVPAVAAAPAASTQSRSAPVGRTSPAAAQAAPTISHSAASHYFPAQQQTPAARPFAHILASDGIPSDIPSLKPAATAPALTAAALREPIAKLGSDPTPDLAAATLAQLPTAPAAQSEATAAELKILRRMLETQMAQLAWNDLSRRAPVHVEILRELTEIGISQELSEYILKQLPDKVELGFARRFAIAGLSQYLLVCGDKWLDEGGRVAFIGSTGVGKTTTLAKLAVRWVLRHGTRDLALVGSDTVRIGAQDQIQSLGQLLGVPVYTPENFESLPTLLSQIGDRHRLILIDTPGSSLRDGQSATRLSVLSNCASHMETALVLAGSTQAGAIEETIKRYAPANPACCVITKLDEAASLGGTLSALIRARLPVAYVSEGQRVPEDLRPARALELVSTAVRLAKASGAAADEELLRRRFGKTAHAIT